MVVPGDSIAGSCPAQQIVNLLQGYRFRQRVTVQNDLNLVVIVDEGGKISGKRLLVYPEKAAMLLRPSEDGLPALNRCEIEGINAV